MDIKVYDQKVKDVQSHLPFLSDIIKRTKASPQKGQFLNKLEQLYDLAMAHSRKKLKLETIIKIEKSILKLKEKFKSKTNSDINETVVVKREEISDKVSVSESISETPDSPSPTRHYERTSPIEIPTERFDDRDIKIKKEKSDKYRFDDSSRHRHDRHGSHDKSDRFRYDISDKYRSRYEQHERSRSRDRFRRDRRDRSESSEKARHGKGDRHRYEHNDKYRSKHDRSKEKYDSYESRDKTGSWKHESKSGRVSSIVCKTETKYERSDGYSATGNRDNKLVINPIVDSNNSVFNRLGSIKNQSKTGRLSCDDKITEADAAEIRSKVLGFDSDDDEGSDIKTLVDARSKLVSQIMAEKEKLKENKQSPAIATSSELPILERNKNSVANPSAETGLKTNFEAMKIETTPKDSVSALLTENAKEDSTNFSFLKTFQQTTKSNQMSISLIKPKASTSIDDDIINKIVTQPINAKNDVSSLTEKGVSAIIQNISPDPSFMDIVKQALATTKKNEEKKNANDRKFGMNNSERLANKYNPKARTNPHSSENTAEHNPLTDVPNANNSQLVRGNDPRLSRVRDPRVQAQQDSMRMQGFSPPPQPPLPFISNYPPALQSVHNYNTNPYPKPSLLPSSNAVNCVPPHPQHPYTGNMSTQYPIQPHPNSKSIPTHIPNYNNQRNLNIHHQVSPVSSTEVSSPIRYSYQSSYPDQRNPAIVHNKFHPSLNDSVERQKYEQSRRNNYDKKEAPMTYGEYRRSLQTVSSTSEKLNNEPVVNPPTTDISKSHLDNVYRSGNYSAKPLTSVTTSKSESVSKFRIPKKKSNEIHSTENIDSKIESNDEPTTIKDSDDSESEISGNNKRLVNSDSEASESRDPRIRVNALKRKSALDSNKAKELPSTEKQNDVVTSSTSLLPDTQSTVTKEDMESMLKQFMNPNNLLTLLTLCGNISDDKMFSKIKDIIQRSNETNQSASIDESTEKPLASTTDVEKNVAPKTPRKNKRNELEKLNEDIRTMFISDGVLTATGRRMCAVYSKNKETATAPKNVKPKKQENLSKDDAAVNKQGKEENPVTGPRIMRRRNTMVCYTEPSGRSTRPTPPTTVAGPSLRGRPSSETVTGKRKMDDREEDQVESPTPATTPQQAVEIVKEQKVAKKATKAAKPKKSVDANEDTENAGVVKRVTRSRITKECNIVLEKLQPSASADNTSGPKKDGKAKRALEVNDTEKVETLKKRRLSAELFVKNNNPDWHCLKKSMECQLCDKPAGVSLVSHYVNCHPNNEIFPSRLTPKAAALLRKKTVDHHVERFLPEKKICHEFRQHCYFCDETKSYNKLFWLHHMAIHTGYYQFKCTDCNRRFAAKNPNHSCSNKNKVLKIRVPQFEPIDIFGYVCDICNYVRLDEKEMEKHLKCEHEGNVAKKYQKFIFMSFPKKKKKSQMNSNVGKVKETSDINVKPEIDEDDGSETSTPLKKIENMDNESAEKVLRSRVVHTEAFIAEPKDDGLFDHDTMKLMKDMSFSASKDIECSPRSNRTKSIAEKLNERFNSVQEDNSMMPCDSEQANPTSLNPLTCDEGIPIVIKTQNDDDYNMEPKITKDMSNGMENASSGTVSVRENNGSPTEDFCDESDDNWESYSSDGSENESVASEEISHTSNKKNVGIIDTITRLQQSISSQSVVTPMDIEKLPEATSPSTDKVTVKEEGNSEVAESLTTEVQVDMDTSAIESEDLATSAIESQDVAQDISKDNSDASLTYESIVEDAIRDGDVKTCVSNGRSSQGSYSFNMSGVHNPQTQFGSRNNHFGGTSSNADSTNNDVDMTNLNCPTKVLTRIYNIGYTSSSSLMANRITFCCLIDQCGFESINLALLLSHIEDHTVEWCGFCYTCNSQVNSNQMPLMMEFKHMTEAHLNKKDQSHCDKNPDQKERTPLIKCKVLPGDKLSKLKEAEIAAKAKQLTIEDTISSTSTIKEKQFMKISNVTSLTTTPVRTDNSPLIISNVVSLGSNKSDYDDSEIVVLKQWMKNPTLKSQKYCRRMMRDIALFALYKCMDINCSFTTDDAEKMLIHLRNHENNTNSQIDNPSDADTPSWLECAYCDEIGDSCLLLVKHVQNEHQSSIFQCPYCFYRSCAAYNVVVHLNQFHRSESKSVLVCNGNPKRYATEKSIIEKSRQEFVRPLRCTEDCKKITFVMDYFVQHMRTSNVHSEKFKCQVCGFKIPITEAAKHLLCHRIGVYECVYCQYGTNDVESIQNHMCNIHPSKLLYICVRLIRKCQVLTDEQLRSVESTLTVHLGQSVDSKLFRRCPYTEQQLSYISPSLEVNSNMNEQPVVSVATPRNPPSSSVTPIDIEITAVTSISNETFSNAETLGTPSSGLMLSGILSYKEFEKEYVSDDFDKYFASMSLPDQTPVPKSKRRSSAAPVAGELPENTTKSSPPSKSRTDLLQFEIDNAAYNLVKGTGLEGSDLYLCGFEDCDEKSTDILAFNVHLLKHNESQKGFKCYHCPMVSKNIVGLKYHIKVHGIHRYFCYFCNHTSAIVNDIQKHMQDTHSRTHVNSIALNPKKVDQNKDMFVVCPRGLRQEELNRFGISLIDRNKRKLATTKKFYSPQDIELLPRQAIFTDFIWCSLCDYSTKVRTNMHRHLAAHKEGESVPKVDPVNPVPCLDTGEKHFDKMINLACSSNDTNKIVQSDPTAFVPEGRRFVCNACRYQTISENMLKQHLLTLHAKESQYKCPHCNTLICQVMDVDKVIFHLRMHDAKIYKCPKCTTVHHIKSIVEKHREEVHIGCKEQIILITRDETNSSMLTDSQENLPKVSKWKCSLCNELCPTQKLIQNHVQTAHCIKFQYQCDICNEVQSNSKATIQEHMSLKHPNVDSRVKVYYTKVECSENDNTPIWRRDDPNKIKHIRGILFEDEHVRKTSITKEDQTEVKKKTSKKKRSDKPVVEQNVDVAEVHVINESESDSIDDNESNAILIISDEDIAPNPSTTNLKEKKVSSSNPTPSTSKNLIESGKRSTGSSSIALTKVSDETTRNELAISGVKNNNESSLLKPYVCGRCFKFSDNTIALVKAHQTITHPNIVCDVFIRNDLKELPKHLPDVTTVKQKPKPRFIDSINYTCFHCILKSQNPQVVYKHWRENHKFPKVTTNNIEFPSRPFMFRISKIFQCYHCRRQGTSNDLNAHSLRNHPNHPVTIIDIMEPNNCALCPHHFVNMENEIVQHFKDSHKNTKTTSSFNEPINYLNDEFLDQIIAVLPKEQVKCTHCSIIFFSKMELSAHTKDKHSGQEMKFEALPNDPIVYGCPKCPKTNASEKTIIEHIREHLIQYQCKFCDKHFQHLEMVKQHHEIMHKVRDQTYRNIDVEKNLDHYLLMKIIFPNGLVLTKGEAKYTRYGSTDQIFQLVTELNEKELEKVQNSQKKVKKRKVVASDNDDSADEVTPLVSRIKVMKRRKIKDSESDSDDDFVQPSKTFSSIRRKPIPIATKVTNEASSEDEPLTNLIPYSFYNKPSKPVNLSKVFTQMQFGTNNIRVSCDRFALLVNINPKLRIKRCTDS